MESQKLNNLSYTWLESTYSDLLAYIVMQKSQEHSVWGNEKFLNEYFAKVLFSSHFAPKIEFIFPLISWPEWITYIPQKM